MSACPACRSEHRLEFSHKLISAYKVFSDTPVFSCLNCEFSWANGIQQASLDSFYTKAYDQTVMKRSKRFPEPRIYFSEPETQFKRGRALQHIHLCRRFLKKPAQRLLDIGAGLGTTLSVAQQNFPELSISAYENDLNCRRYLNYLEADIISGNPIDALSSTSERFDVIIISHFLEHIAAPSINDFLKVVMNLLTPDGVAVFEVPHDNLVLYDLIGTAQAPHVSFFSTKAIQIFFEKYALLHMCPVGKSLPNTEKKAAKVNALTNKGAYWLWRFGLIPSPYVVHGNCLRIVAQRNRS